MTADLQTLLIVGAVCAFVAAAIWAGHATETMRIERHARQRVAAIRRRADELRSQARDLEAETIEKKGSHEVCPTCGATPTESTNDKKISLRGGQPT